MTNEINRRAGMFKVSIMIEHAGPDWNVGGEGDWNFVQDAIEHARWIAPRGATIAIKVESID